MANDVIELAEISVDIRDACRNRKTAIGDSVIGCFGDGFGCGVSERRRRGGVSLRDGTHDCLFVTSNEMTMLQSAGEGIKTKQFESKAEKIGGVRVPIGSGSP